MFAVDGVPLDPPYPSVVSVTSDRCGELVMGQPPRWPEDGNDAIPPGIPGPGGSGGTVSATLPIPIAAMQLSGGGAGRPDLLKRVVLLKNRFFPVGSEHSTGQVVSEITSMRR